MITFPYVPSLFFNNFHCSVSAFTLLASHSWTILSMAYRTYRMYRETPAPTRLKRQRISRFARESVHLVLCAMVHYAVLAALLVLVLRWSQLTLPALAARLCMSTGNNKSIFSRKGDAVITFGQPLISFGFLWPFPGQILTWSIGITTSVWTLAVLADRYHRKWEWLSKRGTWVWEEVDRQCGWGGWRALLLC